MTSTTEHVRRRPATITRAGVLALGITAALGLGVAGQAEAAGYTYTQSAIPTYNHQGSRVAVDESTGALYVNAYRDSSECCDLVSHVQRVDPRTGAISGDVVLPGNPGAIAVDPRTHRVYAESGAPNDTGASSTISVIDPSTFAVVATIRTAGTSDLLVGEAGDLYLATNGDSAHGALQIIDTTSYTTKARVPLGFAVPGRISEDPRSHTVWVQSATPTVSNDETGTTTSRLDVVDTRTPRVVGTVGPFGPIPGGFGTAPFVVDPTRQLAYVVHPEPSNAQANVEVYDTTTRGRVATVARLAIPLQVIVDPVTQTLYAPGFGSAPTAVINLVSRQVTDSLATDHLLLNSAVDSRTHTLYAVNYGPGLTSITQTGSPAAPPSCTEVIGAIGAKYTELGGCTSYLGKPTTFEQDAPGGKVTHFEHGDIYYSAATGAHAITGAIRDTWLNQGGPTSRLGYPTSDEYSALFGRANTFQHGFIYFNPLIGTIPITF